MQRNIIRQRKPIKTIVYGVITDRKTKCWVIIRFQCIKNIDETI